MEDNSNNQTIKQVLDTVSEPSLDGDLSELIEDN